MANIALRHTASLVGFLWMTKGHGRNPHRTVLRSGQYQTLPELVISCCHCSNASSHCLRALDEAGFIVHPIVLAGTLRAQRQKEGCLDPLLAHRAVPRRNAPAQLPSSPR